jgi:hypothetical protein
VRAYFTGITAGLFVSFSKKTRNLAGLVLLALRPTITLVRAILRHFKARSLLLPAAPLMAIAREHANYTLFFGNELSSLSQNRSNRRLVGYGGQI